MTSRTQPPRTVLLALALLSLGGTALAAQRPGGAGTAASKGTRTGAPALTVTAAATSRSTAADPSTRIPGAEGTVAADFALTGLDGKTVRLSDMKGKVVILDFWATWCPPCRNELPHFAALHNDWAASKKVAIVGIALDRNGKSVVGPFVEAAKIPYSILLGTGVVVESYGNFNSIPTTFVIDPAGKIYKRYMGYRDKAVFEADIKALIGKKAAS